jgi:Tol biopolymer transport system component
LTNSPFPKSRPKISPDGTLVAYRVIDERKKQVIYTVASTGGQSRKICADCGVPFSWSSDNKYILFETGKTRATIALLDVSAGGNYRYQQRPGSEILSHADWGIHAAKFSPDDRWVAFHADTTTNLRQIFIARYSGEKAISDSEWIPVTDGASVDQHAAWSPDGLRLYFLSDRDGYRCIWVQKLDPQTHRAAGAPYAIQHFHTAGRSLLTTVGERPDAVGLAISRSLMIVTADEVTSNIWSMDLK